MPDQPQDPTMTTIKPERWREIQDGIEFYKHIRDPIHHTIRELATEVISLCAAVAEEQGKRSDFENQLLNIFGELGAKDLAWTFEDALDAIGELRTRAEQAERERDELRAIADSLDVVDGKPFSFACFMDSIDSRCISDKVYEFCLMHINKSTALRAKVEALERLAVEMRAAADEAYTARAYGVSDALHLFAGRAETSVARTATTPWRSVDLAPKNEWVLVHPQTCGHIAHFVLMNGNLFVWRNEAGRLIDPPTHWMPLPALPTSAAPTPART